MLEVDVKVFEHRTAETANKLPCFTVTLKGLTIEGQEIRLSIRGDKEDLFKKYALKTEHTIKVTNPQTKLS